MADFTSIDRRIVAENGAYAGLLIFLLLFFVTVQTGAYAMYLVKRAHDATVAIGVQVPWRPTSQKAEIFAFEHQQNHEFSTDLKNKSEINRSVP
jgi:hypothetical protein